MTAVLQETTEKRGERNPVRLYRKILAAYDGSENAKRALSRAATLARELGAELGIVVVVNTKIPVYGPFAPYYPADFADQIVKEGQTMLASAIEMVKGKIPDVSGSVEDGNAAEVILEVAESGAADLIVLGRRGISGVERFLMGGVSNSVVSHSGRDVLIVK